MKLSTLIRQLRGEQKGMGSAIRLSDKVQQVVSLLYPSIVIPQKVIIADVSFYQEKIDFVKMKAAGVAGVIVRAGQRYWVDPMYRANMDGAKAAGLLRGVYWFYDSREEPKKQAALWWNTIKNDEIELVAVPDIEDTYNGAYANKASYKAFVSEFQRLSGLPNNKIDIYTGFYWWNEHVGNDAWFRAYRLWLAWYAAAEVVRIPAPWFESDLDLWQFTSSGDGLKYGVTSKEIDLSYYNGTPEQFAERFGHVSQPTGESMYYKATGNITIRTGSSASSPAVTTGELYVLKDDILEVTETANGFAHFVKLYRNNVSKTLAPVTWCGTAYLTQTTYTPPTPPAQDNTAVLNAIANVTTEVEAIAGALGSVHSKLDMMLGELSLLREDVAALRSETPTIPPTQTDGYTGSDMGTYEIIATGQDGDTITTISDSYANETTVLMDDLYNFMAANCPGWAEFQKNGSIVKGEDGLWHYEVKLLKGQLVRIAEVGGKNISNPLGNGRVIGIDNKENDPLKGAVNWQALLPIDKPTCYFHKVPSVPRYFPIINPRQQKGMTVRNAWWVPMKYLKKVS